MYEKRIFIVLIFIAIGIWANLFASLFPPLPALATASLDVNIESIGGDPLPLGDNGLFDYAALPVVVYPETDSAFTHRFN
jgi:hypothetical protein